MFKQIILEIENVVINVEYKKRRDENKNEKKYVKFDIVNKKTKRSQSTRNFDNQY